VATGTMPTVKNMLKTVVLLAGLGGLLMLIGGLLFKGTGVFIGLGLGLVIVGASYWKSDTLAIKAARAVPVTEQEMPQYYAIVRELTEKAGMPMPKLYVTPDEQPNAFATGRNPDHAAVAVTRGILRILDWDELRGVLAHEISHVGNRDILIGSVAAAIALGITFIANILQFTAFFGGGRDDDGPNPIALLALAILAPLAAGLLQMALSRGREFEADRSGARLIGDGEPLARALLKLEAGSRQIPMQIDPAHAQAYIVNPLAAVKNLQFKNLWRSHPPTEDRVARLRSGEWRSAW
jgi:heat shock protein HtpX